MAAEVTIHLNVVTGSLCWMIQRFHDPESHLQALEVSVSVHYVKI